MTESVSSSMPSREALQRLIVQQLRAWRRAGVTDFLLTSSLERVASPAAPTRQTSAEAEPVATAATTATAADPPAAPSAPTQRVTPQRRGLFAETTAGRGEGVQQRVAPNQQPNPMTRAEREQKLSELKACVAQCTRCAELAASRTQTVFGVGDAMARILFVGEAPGADEDRQGEPFVGRAGQLLNRIIEASQLKRDEIYICNILRCRPPGNRNPTSLEADNCREYLDGQIALVDPDYIVCWGSIAAQNLLGTTLSVGRLRGRFLEYGRAKVLCTYHPSYLLRNPASKKDVWADMKFLMRDMGVELS